MSEIINNKIYKTYRIKFEKTGVAKYISHLDLNRLFARSLARAKIEVAHSEGFNPHPKIVFASAISLGTESFCEFVDIKILRVFEKIKDFFPQGINIFEIYEPETKFSDIDKTRYNIFVKPNDFGMDIDDLNKLFKGDVFVEKKPGITINLKDYILELIISDSEREYKLIDAVVKTNQEMFLNPENIIKAINLKYSVGDYFIQKCEVYDKNGGIFK